MTMRERMARAIHATLAGAPSDAPGGWDTLDGEARAPWLLAAQRALAALRAPTDAMLAEGRRRGLPTDPANVWERMIFEAVSEAD